MSDLAPEMDDEFEEDLEDEALDEQPDDEAPVSIEDRARAMGWKPQSEYRGDPRRWTDAATFIAHGEEELPILRDQNRRMSERLARNEGQMATMQKSLTEQAQAVKDAIALARRADEAGYQRALRELKAQEREAASTGDVETFDQVQEQIKALETTRATVETPAAPVEDPPAAPPPQALAPEINAFIRENADWFNDATRPYLRDAMIAMHNAVIKEDSTVPVAEQLVLAKERMAAAYPEILGDEDGEQMPAPTPPRRPARRPASALPPSAPVPPRRPGASPFDAITDQVERDEAKRAFESLKRHDPDMTAREYMTIYSNPHVDTLELRRQRKK